VLWRSAAWKEFEDYETCLRGVRLPLTRSIILLLHVVGELEHGYPDESRSPRPEPNDRILQIYRTSRPTAPCEVIASSKAIQFLGVGDGWLQGTATEKVRLHRILVPAADTSRFGKYIHHECPDILHRKLSSCQPSPDVVLDYLCLLRGGFGLP
jgi:hypothetical protein